MADNYYIGLGKFSLEKFRHILETSEVLPGRKILKEEISERFEILESMGIRNLQELMDALRTKVKVERFSQDSGLPQEYLVILRREANSYIPKPVNLKDILQGIPERLTVAERGVDSSVQQEYLEYRRGLDYDQYSEEDISARSQSLFSPSTPLEEKKETLTILAHRGTVESYRTIERYLETTEQELEGWSVLALQECRVFLEGFLLDRNVGVVMTGLGGEGNRLRYFFMVRSRNDVAFTSAQKATIERGFSHICGRLDSILEEIQVHRDRVTMRVLVPLDVAAGEVIEGGIGECNTFGSFLDANYYVTNDRIPTEEEIPRYLREMGRGEDWIHK
jgi:hypothetical protein